MSTVVVYTSYSGFTRTYAEWIADELAADLLPLKNLRVGALSDYDCVVYGGSLHAVGIAGLKRMRSMMARVSDRRPAQRLVVFAVGASPARDSVISEVRDANIPPAERESVPFYYLRGGFDFSKLDPFHKLVMTLFRWKLSRQRTKSPDVKGMLDAYRRPVDATKRENIRNVVAAARARSPACDATDL